MKHWLLMAVGIFVMANNALAQPAVSAKVAKDRVDFLIGNELATRYLVEGYAKPIFWPIYAPGNIPLTRSWPLDKSNPKEATDHVHQKSVWFCHGDVIPEGLEIKTKIKGVDGIDFWSEAKGHGVIVCTHVGEPKAGKNSVKLLTKNEWRTADGTKVLDELCIISFHDFGKARLIVFDIDLHASTYPITFGDTKEGSMGIRINEEINLGKNGKGKLQNAEGKLGEKECWGKLSAWCDYSGPIDGKTVGLALFDDPKNPYPACWHSRAYGLMAANPFGRDKSKFPAMKGKTDLVKMAKGGHLRFRYGILAHEGDADSGQVAEFYKRFVALGKEKDAKVGLQEAYRSVDNAVAASNLQDAVKAMQALHPQRKDIEKLFPNDAVRLWPLIEKQQEEDQNLLLLELTEAVRQAPRFGPLKEIKVIDVRAELAKKHRGVLDLVGKDMLVCMLSLQYQNNDGGAGPFIYVNEGWITIQHLDLPSLVERARQ